MGYTPSSCRACWFCVCSRHRCCRSSAPTTRANGTRCLQLLALSGVFAGFNYVADVVLNARKQVKRYVFLNSAGTACAIGFPVLFMSQGLPGVGFGWLVGQVGYSLLAIAALTYRSARAPSCTALPPFMRERSAL